MSSYYMNCDCPTKSSDKWSVALVLSFFERKNYHRKHVEPCQIILRRAIWSVRSISFNRDRNDVNIFDVKSQLSMLSSRKPELDFARDDTRYHTSFHVLPLRRSSTDFETLRIDEYLYIFEASSHNWANSKQFKKSRATSYECLINSSV